MHPRPSRKRRHELGSTLIVAMFVITLLAFLIGAALDYTSTTALASKRAQDFTNAQALANGALEIVYKRWQTYMAAKQASDLVSYTKAASFGSTDSPASGGVIDATVKAQIQSAASAAGYNVSLSVVAVTRADVPVLTGQVAANASIGPLANVPGWIAKTYNYRARAVVTKATDPSLSVSISRFFQQSDASLFQAMLFFQDDLELHPGAAMTLYGLVHTNSNMYAVAGGSSSLTFTSNVSYHGSTAPAFSYYNTAAANSVFNYATNGKYVDLTGYVDGITSSLYAHESGSWSAFNPAVWATSRGSQLSAVQALNPLGTDALTATDASNANASGTHEIIERPVPVSASLTSFNPSANPAVVDPDAFSTHRTYDTAGLRVFVDHGTAFTTTVLDDGGNVVYKGKVPVTVTSNIHVYRPSTVNAANSVEIVPGTTPATQNIANTVAAAVTPDASTGDITDFREGRVISADTVDVSLLTPALNAYNAYNGVVYIQDVTNENANGNSGNSDAIRLKKGGVLPDGSTNASGVDGLTVVTDGAVYVQGDYNTGTTYGPNLTGNATTLLAQPDSNTKAYPATGSAPSFTVPGYTQKPAAVMGDAVMILSNNWNDTTSSLTLTGSNRVATPTTFNSAIVSGSVLTTSNAASGGAHNFPRFLEQWNGANFSYHGSMCELYPSNLFTGTYGKANVYNPPSRRWYFDDNYLNSPPPGNLRTTAFTRGRWFHEGNL